MFLEKNRHLRNQITPALQKINESASSRIS
jgi:hypothetical protein